jgi:starch phosphorylase
MTRLLFTTLLWALGMTPAFAQNGVSQRLLELDDGERNGAFTLMLRDSNRTCDRVIRTLFNGTVLGVDDWEALCRDRNSYSISVRRASITNTARMGWFSSDRTVREYADEIWGLSV